MTMATTRPPRVPRAPADEIKHLYYNATRQSVARDLARAIEVLKAMSSDDERARVAVFMDGLSQMRSEWAGPQPPATAPPRPKRRPLR